MPNRNTRQVHIRVKGVRPAKNEVVISWIRGTDNSSRLSAQVTRQEVFAKDSLPYDGSLDIVFASVTTYVIRFVSLVATAPIFSAFNVRAMIVWMLWTLSRTLSGPHYLCPWWDQPVEVCTRCGERSTGICWVLNQGMKLYFMM